MEPVNELNNNDVLFGRGTGASMYTGTRKFREICDERKDDYRMARKNTAKNRIAREVIDQVRQNGGRFLKQNNENVNEDDEVWYEVTNQRDVMEKTKQALRQQQHGSHKRDRSSDDHGAANDINLSFPLGSSGGPFGGFLNTGSNQTASSLSAAPNTYRPATATPVDPRLLLFRASLLNPYLQATVMQELQQVWTVPTMSTTASLPASVFYRASSVASRAGAQQEHLKHQPGPSRPRLLQHQFLGRIPVQFDSPLVSGDPLDSSTHASCASASANAKTSSPELGTKRLSILKACESTDQTISIDNETESESPSNDDEDLEEFLSSVWQLSGFPRFTNHEAEFADMSDDERAKVLSDKFGKYCNVSTRANKKARRDLDPESIAFLLKRMRAELEKIPVDEKQALLQAQEKCREEEFNDERLVQFLRCEGMNAQLGARRFVKYWECRREVFGPDAYAKPMTISGALCDDLAALQTGFVLPLPEADSSGRQLLFTVPARHNREGYTSESMLRVSWYVTEVASRASKHIDCAHVQLAYGKDFTIWELDHWLYKRMNEYEATCLPIRFVCKHAFPTLQFPFITQIVFPIISAIQSKQIRVRSIWHAVPDNEILPVLSDYGITTDMLPTELGGSIRLDPNEWIAQQRAIEMEEI